MGGNHKQAIFSVLILGENFSDWFIKCYCGCIFSIWYKFIYFARLKPAIYKIGNAPNILRPICKAQDESPPPPLPFYLLLQDFQNYFRLIWTTKGFSRNGNNISIDNHLKILPALLEVFLRHLSYCRRKAFNEAYDKINEFSNFKNNLFSRFNKPQDNVTELGSKDTFLRTWNSLLNYDQSLNIQFDWFFSLCNYSG